MAWNPRKTFDEVKSDPMRAYRALGTMGQSEVLRGAEKTAGQKLFEQPSAKDVFGANPMVREEDILKPVTIENPYASQLQAALGQNMGPDFTQAQATGQSQADFAKALQSLYGTGAAGMTGLIGTLQRQQQGDFGPGGSLAQKVLEQGLGQNIAGVRSQLASQRGLSPALAARYAAQQTAQLGGQTAQQAGILGLQQQLQSQQLLGQLTGQAAQLGGSQASALMQAQREQDIKQATATSDASLKRLGILAQSDTGIRQLQAQSGLSANEIRMKIAAANQAAAMGDRQMAASIIGSVLGGASQAAAGVATKAAMAYSGGRIDGKAPLPGDHPQNDIVDAKLSPGEIVIPRSAAGSKKAAKSFIDSLDDFDEEPSYGKVLKARQKKNYADGGTVEPNLDEEILQKYKSQQLGKGFETPIPGVAPMKQSLDEMLTSRVVEPMARAGYPTLGAAMATVPSTLAEALVPSTAADVAMSMLPFPKLGKFKKGISEEIAKKESKVLPEALEPISKKSYKEKEFDETENLYKQFEEKLEKSDLKFTDEQKEAAKEYIKEKLDWFKYSKFRDFYARNVGGAEDFEMMPALTEFKRGEVPADVSDFWLLQREHKKDFYDKYGSSERYKKYYDLFPDYNEVLYPSEYGYDPSQPFAFLKDTVSDLIAKNKKDLFGPSEAEELQGKMYSKKYK